MNRRDFMKLSAASAVTMGAVAGMAPASCAENAGVHTDAEAVSYTHLDVYKRQLTGNLCDRLVALLRHRVYTNKDLSNESFSLIIALLMPATVDIYVCLLYTSRCV